MSDNDLRMKALLDWCQQTFMQVGDVFNGSLDPIAGDASARRYFRCHVGNTSYIVMDSPPKQEACESFVAVAERWFNANIPVPELFHVDEQQGFIIMEDFGNQQLLPLLSTVENADKFYKKAIMHLFALQGITTEYNWLPRYDEARLKMEIALFSEWCLQGLLKISMTSEDCQHIEYLMQCFCDSALAQPQVVVHRDYHARNLMVLNADSVHAELGMIDFQDAVIGPVTYDLVSLLRDCYISWPQSKVYVWLDWFYSRSEHLKGQDKNHVVQWFDWMGAQRHMKVLGIFSRLCLRDKKTRYLQDMPRVFAYFLWICGRYEQLSEQTDWLRGRLIPTFSRQSWWHEYIIND